MNGEKYFKTKTNSDVIMEIKKRLSLMKEEACVCVCENETERERERD